MNKKSHKKKRKRGNGGRGNENENVECKSERELSGWGSEVKDEGGKDIASYEIRNSETMGRYLVASRYIRPGEVIIRTPALMVGPVAGCNIVCLGCYKELDPNNMYRCPLCNWPLCSPHCYGISNEHGHSAHECDALKNIQPNYEDLDELKDCYQAISPLRCLLLKKEDPGKYAGIIKMEAHNSIRRNRTELWENNEKNVVQRLINWGFEYTPEEIHTVCGVIEVNSFEVGSGSTALGLYKHANLLAHDCTPTTSHTDVERAPGRPIVVWAAVPHLPGDIISLCYAYTMQGTLKRREHIAQSKFFDCACKRCADPTELGTFVSAFQCPKCAFGKILPLNPLDNQGTWQCSGGCGLYIMPASGVQNLLQRLTDEYEKIDANDVKGFEGFIRKYRNVLHPSHYLFLCCKHSLSQLYGKTHDYMIHTMPVDELNRKIEICRDIMKAFDVLEPGYSRLRGTTLYELHAPLMILTTRDYEKSVISNQRLKERLQEIVGYLKESEQILSLEPNVSSEGLMAGAARDALKRIKTWERIIGKI